MPKLPEGFDRVEDWEYLTELERDELHRREGEAFNEKAAEAARNSPRVKQAAQGLHNGSATAQELEAAYTEEYEGQPIVTLHVADDTGGERTEVFTIGQFKKALNRESSFNEIRETVRDSYEVVAGYETYGGALAELKVSIPAGYENIPLERFDGTSLQPGRYFVLSDAGVGGDLSNQQADDLNAAVMEQDGLLLAARADQIQGEAEAQAVTVEPNPGAIFEPLELWTAANSAGEYLSLQDLLDGLFTVAITKHLADRGSIGQGTEPLDTAASIIEHVQLAQFKLEEKYVNHALAIKALKGLVHIAHGKPYYQLTPKDSSSNEVYKLTASEDACSRFFANDGGNVEQFKSILETVYTLRTDKRAEGFVYAGRIWFTVNTIVEEMLRTSGGTVRGRDNKKAGKLVDDALLAASGGQVVGTDPAGNPLNVEYLVNATRRDKVEYEGSIYTDVWGFDTKTETINDYASQLAQAYRYPLLDMDKPLTPQQAGIERYLKDILHEARGRLYEKSGNRRQKKTTVKRKWATVESAFKPLGSMEYRQRKKLVSDFETVLKMLADMESKDKVHEGKPIYIAAYSTRQGGRGGHGGAWDSLVIECYSTFRKPSVNLL